MSPCKSIMHSFSLQLNCFYLCILIRSGKNLTHWGSRKRKLIDGRKNAKGNKRYLKKKKIRATKKKKTSHKPSGVQMKGYFFHSDSATGFNDCWQIFIGQLILSVRFLLLRLMSPLIRQRSFVWLNNPRSR